MHYATNNRKQKSNNTVIITRNVIHNDKQIVATEKLLKLSKSVHILFSCQSVTLGVVGCCHWLSVWGKVQICMWSSNGDEKTPETTPSPWGTWTHLIHLLLNRPHSLPPAAAQSVHATLNFLDMI